MHKVLVHNVGTVDFRVDFRHFAQRVAAGLGKKGHKAQFDAVFLCKKIFILVPKRHHLGHVDLIIGGEHGCGVLAVLETLGDGLPQASHFDALLAGGIIRSDRRAGHSRC